MCINLRLLHYELETLFLQFSFTFFLHSSSEFFFHFIFPFLEVSNFFISLFPKGHHILIELLCSNLAFLLKSLSFKSLLANFFETVLTLFLNVILLISLELLILLIGLWKVPFYNVIPSLFYISLLLFFFVNFAWLIDNLFSLILNLLYCWIEFLFLCLIFIFFDKIWIEGQRYHTSSINSSKCHWSTRMLRAYDLPWYRYAHTWHHRFSSFEYIWKSRHFIDVHFIFLYLWKELFWF